MKPKSLYLVLCVLGTIVPYWQFVPWVAANGLHLPMFFQQMLANRISAFFAMDVFLSAVAMVAFMRIEQGRLRIRGRWLPLLGLLTVGVSLALPLFLYLRERGLEGEEN